MDNKEILIQKSLALFSGRGYEAVGVQEICKDAGVTKPTLYHYFGSKRGLFDAIIKKYGDVLQGNIGSAAIYSGNLPLAIEKTAQTFFQFAKENTEFYRLKLSAYFAPKDSESNKAFRKLEEQIFTIVEDLLHESVTKYGNIRGREKITAALIIGGIDTCIGLWLNGFMELNEINIRQSLRLIQYGIYT